MIVVLAALTGCAPEPLTLELAGAAGGVEVYASREMDRIAAFDAAGRPLLDRLLEPPVDRVFVPAPPGTVRVAGRAGGVEAAGEIQLPDGTIRVEVAAPAGGRPVPVADGDRIHLPDLPGGTPVSVYLTADRPVVATVEGVEVALVPARRETVNLTVDPPATLEILGGTRMRIALDATPVPLGSVTVEDVVFPADAIGDPLPARATHRVDLPLPGWRAALARWGLGWRPRPELGPWAWVAVDLGSAVDAPLDLVVRTTVLGGDGRPDPVFAVRLREGRRPDAVAVIRVPARGGGRATLPVWVDPDLAQDGLRTLRIEVSPLSGGAVLAGMDVSLAVSRAGAGLWAATAAVALAALAGWGLIVARWRAWLGPPGEAIAIASLGTLAHAIGAAAQLAGAGVAAILGPFAPFVTGIPDDTLRACVLGALVTMYPRPGVIALATVVGTAVRALALGAFHPVDLLFLGASVSAMELGARVAGLGRPGWTDGPRLARWARLTLGIGLGNLGVTAAGMVVGAAFYRLYYAPWYVAAILLLPGFLYVAAGSALAVGFADSLRRVAP